MTEPKGLQFPAHVPDGARKYLAEQYKTARGKRRALIEKLALRLPQDVYHINATAGAFMDRGWWGTIALPIIVRLAEHSPREARAATRRAANKLRKAAKLANELADALDAINTKDSPVGWIVRDRIIMRWALVRVHPRVPQQGLPAKLRECARDMKDAKPDITSFREAAAASRKAKYPIQDLLRALYTIFAGGRQNWRRNWTATKDIRHAMRIIADLILHDGKQKIDDEAVERACAAMQRYFRKTISRN